MTDSITPEFERALDALCTPERLRAIEHGDAGVAARQWSEVDALGFTDALLPEAEGGAGLSLAEAGELLQAVGRAGLNHPFGETMTSRALLAAAGQSAGKGAIAIARAEAAHGDAVVCRDVSGAQLADEVLVEWRGDWLLMPRAAAAVTPGLYRPQASASLRWESARQASARFDLQGASAETLCNVLHAAVMAGAMERVLAMTVSYAADRRQFGKPIAQFQAIQQELAVMAEQAASAAMGARMGFAGAGTLRPDPLLAAAAKLRACEAAASVAPIAHAVHGAIGITEELLLGVFTARLHELRGAPGSERACAERLGQAVLTSGQGFIDFASRALAPAA
jgi:alkylation response protein AidB-like acyl-CoA dehydrogenase